MFCHAPNAAVARELRKNRSGQDDLLMSQGPRCMLPINSIRQTVAPTSKCRRAHSAAQTRPDCGGKSFNGPRRCRIGDMHRQFPHLTIRGA